MMRTAAEQQLNDALDAIDGATTEAGTAVTAIGARISNLLAQLAGAGSPAEQQALVDKATAEVAKLQPVADALAAMGNSATDPVPVPVPAPAPDPTPAP